MFGNHFSEKYFWIRSKLSFNSLVKNTQLLQKNKHFQGHQWKLSRTNEVKRKKEFPNLEKFKQYIEFSSNDIFVEYSKNRCEISFQPKRLLHEKCPANNIKLIKGGSVANPASKSLETKFIHWGLERRIYFGGFETRESEEENSASKIECSDFRVGFLLQLKIVSHGWGTVSAWGRTLWD